MKRDHHKLKLESLESRMMLAATLGPEMNDAATVAAAESSVQDADAHVDVQLLPYGRFMKVSGPGYGNVTIDLDLLPGTVDFLQITSFHSVTLIGEHELTNLMFQNVRFVEAGQVAVSDQLQLMGVEHIRIDETPIFVDIMGAGGYGTEAPRTLLEVDRFSSDPTAVINALVDSLGLAAKEPVNSVLQIYTSGSVLMNFEPANGIRTNSDSVRILQSPDYHLYFFASASERATLEQSPTILLQAARTAPLSLAGLLGNPFIRAMMTETGDAGAQVRARLVDADMSERLAARQPPALATEAAATESARDALVFGERIEFTSPRSHSLPAAEAAGRDSEPTLAEVLAMAETTQLRFDFAETENQSDGPDYSERAALAFDRVITGLRDQLTTFGEMISSEFENHLRSDRQLALLGEARPARERSGQDIHVVSV
jgi:hypothetical protein